MRKVTLTVGLTLATVIVLIGLAAAGWYGHRIIQERDHAQHASNRLTNELANEDNRASNSYQSGYNAGIASSTTLAKTTHTTYTDGYKDGWQGVFAGFPANSWTDGNWYLVKVDHSKYGHEIERLVDVTPCQQMYESNDYIYVGSMAC